MLDIKKILTQLCDTCRKSIAGRSLPRTMWKNDLLSLVKYFVRVNCLNFHTLLQKGVTGKLILDTISKQNPEQ